VLWEWKIFEKTNDFWYELQARLSPITLPIAVLVDVNSYRLGGIALQQSAFKSDLT
jgi:hypothetical protein